MHTHDTASLNLENRNIINVFFLSKKKILGRRERKFSWLVRCVANTISRLTASCINVTFVKHPARQGKKEKMLAAPSVRREEENFDAPRHP